MATEDTALARAVITLVTGFHEAANNRPSMSIAQFKTLVSQQIPEGAKRVEDEESLRQLLQEMGVENDQNISFENFWEFIKDLAIEESTKVRQDKEPCVLM